VAFSGSATDPSPADTSAGFSYSCDFGDSTTSTVQSPSHAYAAAGTYTARLTVTDKDGGSASTTATVTVTTVAGPTANAGANQTGNEGSAVTFSGSASGGVAPLTYSWAFGDGGSAT